MKLGEIRFKDIQKKLKINDPNMYKDYVQKRRSSTSIYTIKKNLKYLETISFKIS
ncbi:MAG: hypothetical protein ACTSPY_18330 [Candidatus Helarchaeota archaeon]